MSESKGSPTPEQAMRFLAAVGGSSRESEYDLRAVTRSDDLVWAGDMPAAALEQRQPASDDQWSMSTAALGNLSQRDALHSEQKRGRVGWIWVTHCSKDERGLVSRYCFPLLQRAVSFRQRQRRVVPLWLRDLELNPALVARGGQPALDAADVLKRRPLELSNAQAAAERKRVEQVLRVCGLDLSGFVPPTSDPFVAMSEQGLFASIGAGFYLDRNRNDRSLVADPQLARWQALGSSVRNSAFGALFSAPQSLAKRPKLVGPRSVTHLNAAQESVLDRLRSEPLVVVSGPPGTGKTHLIAEVAGLAVQSGWSVAITTASAHAENAVIEALDRNSITYLQTGRKDAGRSGVPIRRLRKSLREQLRAQAEFGRLLGVALKGQTSGAEVDVLFDSLAEVEPGVAPTTHLLEGAKGQRRRRWSGSFRDAMAGSLAESLQPGRIAAGPHLLVSTVAGIGKLRTRTRLFDLVILDESSQIDLLGAAGVLCRGKRALVVGDPRQLRHWSPTDPANIERARRHAKLDTATVPASLNVQDNSLFDVAAGVSPVTVLTDHYRSLPHLIEFSAQRWYPNALNVVTRHPRNEGRDRIDTVQVPMTQGVHAADTELAAVMDYIGDYLAARPETDTRTIGVIAPFPDQARMVEDMVVLNYGLEAIVHLGLRVGTIDQMVGSERDIILITLGVVAPQFGEVLPILEDPERFNVMVTRARDLVVVFHSFNSDDLPAGLFKDYFRHEAAPSGAPLPRSEATVFQRELAAELRTLGYRVIVNYPVGSWTLDMVVGEGHRAIAIETQLHHDGTEAHISRRLGLHALGWQMFTMFASEWRYLERDAASHIAARIELLSGSLP